MRLFLLLFTIVSLLVSSMALHAQPVQAEYLRRLGFGGLWSGALSPDGRFFVTAGNKGAFLWDADTGELVREFRGQGGSIRAAAFSPDGSRLLTASSNSTVMLWEVSTGVSVRTLAEHTDQVYVAAFSPDGTRLLSSGNDNTARIWDADTGALLRTFPHRGDVGAAAFSSDGRWVVTGCTDSHTRIFDVETGEQLKLFEGYESVDTIIPVTAVAISPDLRYVLVGYGDTVSKLFDIESGSALHLVRLTHFVQTARFTPDGTGLLLGDRNGVLKLFEAATMAERSVFSGHSGIIVAAEFHPDQQRLISFSTDFTTRIWDLASQRALHVYEEHTHEMRAVVYSPDGSQIATGLADATVRLWDAHTGAPLRKLEGHSDIVMSAAYSTDGRLLVTGADDSIVLWDAQTGALLRKQEGDYIDSVDSVGFSPDGRYIFSSWDYQVMLWDTVSGERLRSFTGHGSFVRTAQFSFDGNYLLTGSWDATAKLWDVATGQDLRTFGTSEPGFSVRGVYSAALSPDQSLVATGHENGLITVWDAASAEKIRELSGHSREVTHLDFAPDGTHLLSGSWDNSARLWNVATGQEVRTLAGHSYSIDWVDFSPDGTRMVTAGRDGVAYAWESGLDAIEHTIPREKDRVIIVAGGGPYATNSIAAQTRALAEQAHLASTIRGIPPSNITYLSSFETSAENPRVDGAATLAALEEAIVQGALDARMLTIFLLDHGEHDPAMDEWYFYLNADSSPREVLAARELDRMLDLAQQAGLRNLVVVVDACYAGGFVRNASSPPPGYERVVLASTTADRLANYGGGQSGGLSFTYFLLSELIKGVTFRDAHMASSGIINSLRVPRVNPQRPWIEDDGDGIPTLQDGSVAARSVLGRTAPFGALAPELLTAPPAAVLPAPQDVAVEIETGPGRVDGATAVISWSGQFYPEGSPITSLAEIPLARVPGTPKWRATIPSSALADPGIYQIVYTAYREDPVSQEIRFASNALIQEITIGPREEVEGNSWLLK